MSRCTGRTTNQILNAPPDAFYICHSQPFCQYAKNLAMKLGRNDLKFFSIHSSIYNFSLAGNQIVIDHYCFECAVRFTESELKKFDELLTIQFINAMRINWKPLSRWKLIKLKIRNLVNEIRSYF